MQISRRQHITRAGETLAIPQTALDVVVRPEQYAAFTGLDLANFVTSTISSIPIPLRRGLTWQGTDVRAAALWHPLMWLPERLQLPDFTTATDQESVKELLQEWVLAVELEVVASGIYRIEDGTWLDVLSLVGLNVDEPDDLARVDRWVNGAVDEALDSLDLDVYLTRVSAEDPHWSKVAAAEVLAEYTCLTWALIADDLFGVMSEGSESTDPAEIADVAEKVLTQAIAVLGDVPGTGESETAPERTWTKLLGHIGSLRERSRDEINQAVEAIIDSLYNIREDYWVYVEQAEQEGNLDRANGEVLA